MVYGSSQISRLPCRHLIFLFPFCLLSFLFCVHVQSTIINDTLFPSHSPFLSFFPLNDQILPGLSRDYLNVTVSSTSFTPSPLSRYYNDLDSRRINLSYGPRFQNSILTYIFQLLLTVVTTVSLRTSFPTTSTLTSPSIHPPVRK